MKTTCSLLSLVAIGIIFAGCASKYDPRGGTPAPVSQDTPALIAAEPAPTYRGVTAPRTGPTSTDTQQLYGATTATLPQQQHAGEIINAFRPVYEQLGKPLLTFYINRDLGGAAKPSIKTTPAPSGKGVVVTTNPLADKQTTRDIERIAAQPFLQAGATIADATSEPADTGIAIETLVSSRYMTLPSISGDATTLTIPDIQMTAIRISDSAILGQATAADIVNQLPAPALHGLKVQEVLEATTLNLMANITARAK